MAESPHATSADQVLEQVDSRPEGLPSEKARQRRTDYGENTIVRASGRSALGIFLDQFNSVLIWVLLAAAELSIWASHTVDAVLISVIVVANGVFGFAQEYRDERSLESLRELAAPTAIVRREGDQHTVEATDLVPGDVVVPRSGNVVPADGRLLETSGLETDEAALTGESTPVSKSAEPVDAETPLAERTSMVYKGTTITRGTTTAVVTETGMETAVGEVAHALASTEETRTPLQEELDELGRMLGVGVVLLSIVVAPVLVVRGTEAVQAALTAVSLAVAAVPEGLPAVVTLTLAVGVRGMSAENALVRRLPAGLRRPPARPQ